MPSPILIVHAEDEEQTVETLAKHLEDAGYEVLHRGRILPGEDVIEVMSKHLSTDGPIVFWGTAKTVRTRWVRSIVDAAQMSTCKIYIIQVERDANVNEIALSGQISRYWKDPQQSIQDLLKAIETHYPLPDPSTTTTSDVKVEESRKVGKDCAWLPTIPEDIPPLLPYMCDRTPQENELTAALKSLALRNRPLIYVIHGKENECHEHFRERLHEDFLPSIRKLSDGQPVKVIQQDWPTSKEHKDLYSVFRCNLSYGVFGHRLASEKEIVSQFSPRVTMVHTTLFERYWMPSGETQFKAFLHFWDTWGNLKSRQRLIVCLFVKYNDSQAGDRTSLREFLDQFELLPYPKVMKVLLSELHSIKYGEVEDFARAINNIYRRISRVYVSGDPFRHLHLIEDLWNLYHSPELGREREPVAMKELAKEMLPLLRRHYHPSPTR